MSDRFTLYGTPTSGPVYKVALALSLLGLNYRYRFVDFSRREQKSPDHLALNRFGEVPVLALENGPTLSQSGAILEWLADRYGRLGGDYPLEARQWLFWTADRLAIPVYRARAVRRGRLAAGPETETFFHNAAKPALELADAHLSRQDWLVGDSVSIADIDLYPVLYWAREGGFDLAEWPHLAAFKARFEILPGWKPQPDLAPAHDRD
ncbi:MAG TPA: glutathione S-transferase family protein [Candidatus Sulfotelmatobacter sp.]|jgi:glutathione S-transferase|nr:glutathione S-transferase family protein [Candidatus Sulfotelmatobacter sp.]